MSSKKFWRLTIGEFSALRDIQQAETVRWASDHAAYLNANFKTDGTPYIPSDFLGLTDREERARQNDLSARAAAFENRKLSSIKPRKPGDAEPEGLPEWARMTPEEEARVNRGTNGR